MSYDALRKGRFSCSNQIYFITVISYKRKLVFENLYVARAVVREMKRLHETGIVNSIGWVLMPYHLHWLLQLTSGKPLSEVMHYFKGRSARSINQLLNHNGSIWQRAYYDHAVRMDENLRSIARYLVANPLRAGLVKEIGDYPLWDAIWVGENTIID